MKETLLHTTQDSAVFEKALRVGGGGAEGALLVSFAHKFNEHIIYINVCEVPYNIYFYINLKKRSEKKTKSLL